MKFSKNFERDWDWYVKYKDVFIFSGSLNRELLIDLENGKSAKECFFILDSQGKLKTTNEPELLAKVIKCKESINFQIKEYAQDRAKGYLPKIEFDEITKEFELLEWMIKAVEQQKVKYY
jgi:hypothetical protein